MKNDISSELQMHRQQWQSQNITNYQYTFNKICFCPPPANQPFKLFVKNKAVTSVTNLETNQPILEPDQDFYKSIDQLFEVIEEAIQRGADEISVTYDSKLGYPTRIAIDYIKLAADDEISFSASDLVVLDN